jgi:hypothetical protein
LETEKSTSIGNKVTLKYQFDKQTLLQLKSLLEEIDRNQQSLEVKPKYIKFSYDKEYKILSFTGKVVKKKVQTELEYTTPDEHITRYLFECYDITITSRSEVTNDMLAIWDCGSRDARTILYLLSKNFTELDVVCDMQPDSKITTYQIYARLDSTL